MIPTHIAVKILKIKKESNFFNTVLNFNELDWNSIIQAMNIFKAEHPLFKGKYSYSINQISTLEKSFETLGLDYNSVDVYGNKFLDYALDAFKEPNKFEISSISSEAIDYIIKKTDDIYQLNPLKQNILFNLLEGYPGCTGKEFLKYSKEYDFNLSHADIYGKTVFHYVIEKNSHIRIAQYLVDKIQPHIIDKQGKTLLFLFENTEASQDNIDIFDKLLKHVANGSKQALASPTTGSPNTALVQLYVPGCNNLLL